MTRTAAKRFFVDRVVAQAASEGTQLSKAEKGMLGFSETDPDYRVDPALVDRLSAEISDADYEAKIAGLLQRAREREVTADAEMALQWREARQVLNQGDHYMLIMIEQAFGSAPSWAAGPLRVAGKAGLFVVLVVPGLVALLIAMGLAVGIVVQLLSEPRGSIQDLGPLALGMLILGAGGTYLLRLWMRENRR